MKSLCVQAVLLVVSLTSCKLVYTTSEVQQNLKQTADEFAKNTSKARKEFQLFTSEYNSFHCISTKSPFTEAERKMEHLNTRIKELESINTSVQKEYLDFLSYTKGKKELTSNSVEWDKLKTTKKHYKLSISQYQEKSEILQKEASAFQMYISSQISPSIQKCDVISYTKKATDALTTSEKNANSALTKLLKLEGQVTTFILNNQMNQPELCATIQKEWFVIKQQEGSIAALLKKLSDEITSFSTNTKGKTVIYSCSEDWRIVDDFEKRLTALQAEVGAINQTITKSVNAMNTLINPVIKE